MSKTIQIGEIPITVTLKDVDNVHLSIHSPDRQISLVAPESLSTSYQTKYKVSQKT